MSCTTNITATFTTSAQWVTTYIQSALCVCIVSENGWNKSSVWNCIVSIICLACAHVSLAMNAVTRNLPHFVRIKSTMAVCCFRPLSLFLSPRRYLLKEYASLPHYTLLKSNWWMGNKMTVMYTVSPTSHECIPVHAGEILYLPAIK